MFRVIWQYLSNSYAKHRFGLDNADVQHIRADLRFRLAMVEYAYFGRRGKNVGRALAELKSLLGEKAMHRYLKSLDPDLRTQFMERFQNKQQEARADRPALPRTHPDGGQVTAAVKLNPFGDQSVVGSNVVPFGRAAFARGPESGDETGPGQLEHSGDSAATETSAADSGD